MRLFLECMVGQRFEGPIRCLMDFLLKSRFCLGSVWVGSSARIGITSGDIDVLVFCRPQGMVAELADEIERILMSSRNDVLVRIPFLQQMGSVVSVYYEPEFVASVDVGVIGEHWWPLVRLEPFAKTLWKKEGFPTLLVGRSGSVERTFEAEFWTCVWKIRKATQRKNYPRALEYLNRARRAVLGKHAEARGEFCYSDRPEHYDHLFEEDVLECLVSGFVQPSDLAELAGFAIDLVARSANCFAFTAAQEQGLDVVRRDLGRYCRGGGQG